MNCFIHLFIELIFESLLYARHLKFAGACASLSSTFHCMALWYCLGTRWGLASRLIRKDLEAWATRGLITSWFNTSRFGAIIDTNHTLIWAAHSRRFQGQPETLHTWMPLFTTLSEFWVLHVLACGLLIVSFMISWASQQRGGCLLAGHKGFRDFLKCVHATGGLECQIVILT